MNGLRTESIRGWIGIGLVAIGGVAASLHSFYTGQASALVMKTRIEAIEIDIRTLQDIAIKVSDDVTTLNARHRATRH